MTGRRELTLAVVACGAGAGLVLVAAGQPWVHAVARMPPPLPHTGYDLTGRELAPAAAALGVAGMAGLAGLLATRRWARMAVAVLLLAFGVGVVASSALATRAPRVHDAVATSNTRSVSAVSIVSSGSSPWRLASVAGGALLGASGVWTLARGRGWPGLSARYDSPGGTPRTVGADSAGPIDLWRSLDRGADPTRDRGDPDSPT